MPSILTHCAPQMCRACVPPTSSATKAQLSAADTDFVKTGHTEQQRWCDTGHQQRLVFHHPRKIRPVPRCAKQRVQHPWVGTSDAHWWHGLMSHDPQVGTNESDAHLAADVTWVGTDDAHLCCLEHGPMSDGPQVGTNGALVAGTDVTHRWTPTTLLAPANGQRYPGEPHRCPPWWRQLVQAKVGIVGHLGGTNDAR